jgi:hypothetical protein
MLSSIDWYLVPDVLGQTVGPETLVTTNRRCLTSQKSEDLIFTAAEAWDHAHYRYLTDVFQAVKFQDSVCSTIGLNRRPHECKSEAFNPTCSVLLPLLFLAVIYISSCDRYCSGLEYVSTHTHTSALSFVSVCTTAISTAEINAKLFLLIMVLRMSADPNCRAV